MRRSSQELWTEGEALDRAGRARDALDLYVQAAGAEEDAGQHLRARLLWEQIARKFGVGGLLLERLAAASERARLRDDAFDYWLAAAVRYHSEGRAQDAERARTHASRLKSKGVPPHERAALAQEVLAAGGEFVADLA